MLFRSGLGFATLAFNNLSGIGRSGKGTLTVDNKLVATETMERTVPLVMNLDDEFNVGATTATPLVDGDYEIPFKFTGKIDKITVSLEPPQLTPADMQKLQTAQRSAQDAN